MSKAQIQQSLDIMDQKFEDTLAGLVGIRSIETDIFRAVIPIMQEQNKIMRSILELVKE